MTTAIATIAPEATVEEAARVMVNRRISGLPVIDGDGRLVGIISEGDLVHRAEVRTERRRSRWGGLFSPNGRLAADYVKAHAKRVATVMTREVVSVERMARLDEIADLFDAKAIKRVPVVDDGKLVGIVSRADLLRVLASGGAGAGSAGEVQDRAIRDTLLADLARQDWTHSRPADLVVVDCVVHLWGVVGSEAERQALRIAAENTPGVRAVADHTTVDPLFPVL